MEIAIFSFEICINRSCKYKRNLENLSSIQINNNSSEEMYENNKDFANNVQYDCSATFV